MDPKQYSETVALAKLRNVTKDLYLDDDTLLRFLRARDLDNDRAEAMVRKAVHWRTEKQIDFLDEFDPPETVVSNIEVYFTGFNKFGIPVYVLPAGKWDAKKVIKEGYKAEMFKYCYKCLERILNFCSQHGVTKFSVIIDNQELSFRKVTHWESIEALLEAVRNFEANYPETMEKVYAINCPSIFWQAFKIIKPLLSPITLKKIEIYDHDKKKWMAILERDIDEKNLPKIYGGFADLKPLELMIV